MIRCPSAIKRPETVGGDSTLFAAAVGLGDAVGPPACAFPFSPDAVAAPAVAANSGFASSAAVCAPRGQKKTPAARMATRQTTEPASTRIEVRETPLVEGGDSTACTVSSRTIGAGEDFVPGTPAGLLGADDFDPLAAFAWPSCGTEAFAVTCPNSSRVITIGRRQSGQLTGAAVIWSSRTLRSAEQ